MDGQRFDALTRALATAKSRRSVLGALLASAGALILPRAGRAEGAYCGVTCVDSGQNCDGATDGCSTCCDPLCVDNTTDPNNCGNCGTVCPGGQYAVCVNAVCGIVCPDGFTVCGDGSSCADLANDPQNCLSCGFACPAGQVCCGQTGCIDLTIDLHNCSACGNDCGIGNRCCNSTCLDPNTDGGNCGDCGVACAADQSCRGGACVARCPAGQLFCDPDCVDAQNDGANCGACGTACGQTEVCQGGGCVSTCAAGTTNCGSYCADLTADQNNCGACGTVCSRETRCENGNCIRPQCPSAQTKCDDGCFDLKTDPSHCGGCHNVCIAGTTCCAGGCFDLTTDANHCGSCDHACPPGFTCDGKGGCEYSSSGTGFAGGRWTASPDFCAVKGREAAVIEALLGVRPIVTPPPPKTWAAITKGANKDFKAASDSLTQVIAAAVVQVSACGSANDASRQTALMTDDFASQWLTERSFTADLIAAIGKTTPAPLPAQSWEVFAQIGDVYDLGGGRASALVSYAPLAPSLPGRREIHFFKKMGDNWLLDGVRREEERTAKTGSLLARLFECPLGVSLTDQTTHCAPAPELAFRYEIRSTDGSVRKSAADAKFIDAGLLLWDNLTPGGFGLRVDAPAGVKLVTVTPGSALTPGGDLITLVEPGAHPAVIDVYHERTIATDVLLRLRTEADCPPCSRKDALHGICVPTCPGCSNCRSVKNADGSFASSCQSACTGDQICSESRACCQPDGGTCAANADCCGGACEKGFCGCLAVGEACGGGGAACCSGALCGTDKKVCTACKPVGQTCKANSECCDGDCFKGVCHCCAAVPDNDFKKTPVCCEYPRTALIVPASSAGPAFQRCCVPGVDCTGDPLGPTTAQNPSGDAMPRVCPA